MLKSSLVFTGTLLTTSIFPHKFTVKTNQELAKYLKGHLLLVTGEVDNNVHPANTFRVANELILQGKDFDLLVLPGQGHGYDATELK